MKSFLTRLQTDFNHLQNTIQKEGNDLLKKIKKVDLKDNLDNKRKELEKIVSEKLHRLEPLYHQFIEKMRTNAKKAGIDVDRIEKEILKTAHLATAKLKTTAQKHSNSKIIKKVSVASEKITRKLEKRPGAKKSPAKTPAKPKPKTTSKKSTPKEGSARSAKSSSPRNA